MNDKLNFYAKKLNNIMYNDGFVGVTLRLNENETGFYKVRNAFTTGLLYMNVSPNVSGNLTMLFGELLKKKSDTVGWDEIVDDSVLKITVIDFEGTKFLNIQQPDFISEVNSSFENFETEYNNFDEFYVYNLTHNVNDSLTIVDDDSLVLEN